MNLVNYQQEIAMQIYDLLVTQDKTMNINLIGKSGSGKTTIGLELTQYFKENWKLFYLCGINSEISPYLTWHIGTKLFSQKKLNIDLSVSFGIPNIASSVIEIAMPKLEKMNPILNSCEESIISSIKKQAEGCHKILFIIDDYELWDIPSKQLVEKIMIPSLGLLNEYDVSWLFLSNKDSIKNWSKSHWHNINIKTISDNDMCSILTQNGFTDLQDITKIKLCAEDNLHLALLAANYYEKGIGKFNDFLESRINTFNYNDKKAISLLESLSIIETSFSHEEAAFFLDPSSLADYELEYQADEYLSVAEKHKFIDGEEMYYFSSQDIKNYFKLKLAKREKMLHHQFAKFLQKKHPEDYYSRGKHIQYSIFNSNKSENNDAWQMLFLAYMRWNFTYGFEKDHYNIMPKIRKLIALNQPIQQEHQTDILEKLLQGCNFFEKYDYKNALLQMQSISESLLCPALRAECLRIILLCFLQLADNLDAIRSSAESLYQLIEQNDFEEDEQYCRAALVMLEVYSDRCVNEDRANLLKIKLENLINKHQQCSDFLALNAAYNRKAALFYVAEIAYNRTILSITFYRKCNEIKNLYMALCNNAANAVICGKYDFAKRNLDECLNMINEYTPTYFPSVYKIENNIILTQYLKNEYDSDETDEAINNNAKIALTAYETLLSKPQNEISHVVYLNWLGLSILCNTNDWKIELKKIDEYFTDTDLFYEYYYRDLKFAAYLLQQNIKAAKTELDILDQIHVPLLLPYKVIFQKRRQIQRELLENQSLCDGNAIKYHKIMKQRCSHVQDSSCSFYGRGFLLSDLQFLSF